MLVLNNLQLQDFMCCKNVNLNFPANGLTILQGENGQGKSAILEAIAVCLAEHKRADSFKEFVRIGAQDAYIKLDCDYNGENIKFDVKIGSKGGTWKDVVYKNKHYKNSEVTSLLDELELNFYADIILSMQGTDSDITSMSPTQRANLLQRLFQFDFEQELKAINEQILDYERVKLDNDNNITTYNNFIQNQINSKKDVPKLPFTIGEYIDYRAELAKIKNDLTSDFTSKYTEANTKWQDVKYKIKLLEQAKASVVKYESDVKSISEKIAENENAINNFVSDSDTSSTDSLNESIEVEKKQRVDINKQIESNLNLISKNEFTIKDCESHIKLGEAGKCPTCGHDTKNINVDDLKDSIIKCKNEIEGANSALQKLRSALKESEMREQAANVALREQAAKEASTKSEYKHLLDEKERLNKEFAKLQSNPPEKSTREISVEMFTLTEEEKTLKVNVDNAYAEVQKIEKQKSLFNDYEQKVKEYEKAQQNIKNIEEFNKNVDKEVESLREKIKEAEKASTDAEKQIEYNKEAKKVLDTELPNFLIIKTCAKLEAEMNNFIQVVFPDLSVILRQNKKGVEFFYVKDGDLLSTKMASGFEKATLSVAFKVALCKAYNLSFSALDEVDSAASQSNSEKLFNSLISENVFSQLIVITHKKSVCETIKDLSDQCYVYHVDHGTFTLEYN